MGLAPIAASKELLVGQLVCLPVGGTFILGQVHHVIVSLTVELFGRQGDRVAFWNHPVILPYPFPQPRS